MTETTLSPPAQLDLEVKRQSLFASLLKYASEAGPLRDRALERLVLVGLLGSTEANPYRVGVIQTNLKFSPHCPEIRTAAIMLTIQRLETSGQVRLTQLRGRNAYYLSASAAAELARQVDASSALFRSILRRILQSTDYLLPFDEAATICRTFICESFARFGLRLAKTVIGDKDVGDAVGGDELRGAFAAATKGRNLSPEAWHSLQARCAAFIRSKEPDDERLKFYLTQGYFLSQLLGLDTPRFNPLAEGAFAGGIFYLDTNVLIPRILASEAEAQMFDEMIGVARRNGIELRVTRATIDELRRVAADRETQIKAITAIVPVQLSERTSDAFLEKFLTRRDGDPSLTVEAFIEPFLRAEHILLQILGVTVEEHVTDDLEPTRAVNQAREVVQAVTVAGRGWPKSPVVIEHDLLLYSLVLEARARGQKAWLLTMDTNMLKATAKLDPDQPPAAFSFVGLLQSISPYVANAGAENSLVDVFSGLLSNQVMGTDRIFDIQELKLIAEMHEDILTTSPDQLNQAFDYVKSAVLHGRAYRPEDRPTVALGLRKFLSGSADERNRQLVVENERLRAEAERRAAEGADERHLREEAEQTADTLASRVVGLEEEAAHQATLADASRRAARKAADGRRLRHMIYGVVAGTLGWLVDDGIVAQVTTHWPGFASYGRWCHALLGATSLLAFTVPSAVFITARAWRTQVKAGVLTLVFSLAVGLSGIIDDGVWAAWSAYIQAAALVATLVVFCTEERRARRRLQAVREFR